MPQAHSHCEDANFLRELADSLPRVFPDGSKAKSELLQRLANEELAQAEYDEWVRAKVSAARANNRPGMSTEQLRTVLQNRAQAIRDATV